MAGLTGAALDARVALAERYLGERKAALADASALAHDQERVIGVLRGRVASAEREAHALEMEGLSLTLQVHVADAEPSTMPRAPHTCLLDPATPRSEDDELARADARRWNARIAKVSEHIEDATNHEDMLATDAAERASALKRRIHLARARLTERLEGCEQERKTVDQLTRHSDQLKRAKNDIDARMQELEQRISSAGGLLPESERARRRAVMEQALRARMQRAERDRAVAAARMARTEERLKALRWESDQLASCD